MKLGGRFTFPGTDLTVNRVGFGAMQLAGPGVWGEPKDRAECIAVAREAVAAGVDHIDTSDFYGPHVTNLLLHEALAPYPDDLVLVTKIGAKRGEEKAWVNADSDAELRAAAEDNLRNLGVDTLQVVNYRRFAHALEEGSIARAVTALAEMQERGVIQHIGLSNVTATQVAEAQGIAKIVCVQNDYNLAHREDDALIDSLAAQGIAYVPFFPLGRFSPLQSSTLNEVAAGAGATPLQVALAWLLHRSLNILLIPGTSSVAHLRENLAVGDLELDADALAKLDGIAGGTPAARH